VILDGSQIPCAARRSPGLSGPQQKDRPWGWTCRRRCCARRPPAQQEGLTNVHFEHGDAQVSGFTPGAADVAVSRFGVMFFAEPAGAFANIAAGLRLGASARRWAVVRGSSSQGPCAISISRRSSTAASVAYSLPHTDVVSDASSRWPTSRSRVRARARVRRSAPGS